MSYLQRVAETPEQQELGLGVAKLMISLWVKTSSRGPDDKWKEKWLPPHIDTLLGDRDYAYSGASYWMAYPQLNQPHLWCYPPGDEFGDKATFKDGIVPFISWGDPKQVYRRVEWKFKVVRDDFYSIRIGRVNYDCQYPESVGDELGVVPPSCIGVYNRTGNLRIILQTDARAKYTGYAWAIEKSEKVHIIAALIQGYASPAGTVTGWKDFYGPGHGAGDPTWFGWANWYKDVSELEFNQHPETFVMDPEVRINDGNWHHILLSVDLGEGKVLAPPQGPSQPGAPPPSPVGGTLVVVEATGPKPTPPWPGTYGQYSGPDGPMEPSKYPFPESGAPNEDCGLNAGPADGGTIKSGCMAWLWVDGVQLKGKNLHHKTVWEKVVSNNAKIDLSELENNDKIVPVNALVALTGDPRIQLTTSHTDWERNYRTLLGGFYGPASKIDVTDELRRFSYDLPKYELGDIRMSRGGFAIPAGTLWDPNGKDTKWNLGCKLAELQIWIGKAEPLTKEIVNLFIKDNKPVPPADAEKVLGKPTIKLHFTSNWQQGKDTGTDAFRLSGDGKDKKKVPNPDAKIETVGQIDRYDPDPELNK